MAKDIESSPQLVNLKSPIPLLKNKTIKGSHITEDKLVGICITEFKYPEYTKESPPANDDAFDSLKSLNIKYMNKTASG